MLPNCPKYVANYVKYVANWLSRLVTFAPTPHYQIKLSTLVFITYASPMLAGLLPDCHIFIAEYRAHLCLFEYRNKMPDKLTRPNVIEIHPSRAFLIWRNGGISSVIRNSLIFNHLQRGDNHTPFHVKKI
jgi:hypothetical protein